MRATSIGHAGILIDTAGGSIVCDPWFLPAFFDSWCVFPRNDQLSADLMHRIEHADYLYITHLHGDHLDEPWLRDHISRDIQVLVPGYPTRELERTLRGFGFEHIIRTVDGQEMQLNEHLTIAIHCETSISDGPGGDSAMVVSDGTARLVNQNDCRTNDLNALRAHGPVDLHWLQYSGAIWYPMVYEMPTDEMRALVDAKTDAQFARAMRYVEAIDAASVVPSAGPPAFLDPDLYQFNVISGDEPSIFPDQRSFLARLAAADRHGVLAIPGTQIEVHHGQPAVVRHPMPEADVAAIFEHKDDYLRRYQADWMPYLQANKQSWAGPSPDLLTAVQAWWEPILRMAPTLCAAVGGCVVVHLTGEQATSLVIDFPNAQVREFADEPHDFWFRIDRRLVETVVAQRAVDWSNALFLSCRFQAWRAGPFNEYVYNFFKSLSVERMRQTEAEALRKLDPDRGGLADQDIQFGDYMVQRTCPHRAADLAVFGEVEGCVLTCTLHGWRFDLETGECLTADDRKLRVRKI